MAGPVGTFQHIKGDDAGLIMLATGLYFQSQVEAGNMTDEDFEAAMNKIGDIADGLEAGKVFNFKTGELRDPEPDDVEIEQGLI